MKNIIELVIKYIFNLYIKINTDLENEIKENIEFKNDLIHYIFG